MTRQDWDDIRREAVKQFEARKSWKKGLMGRFLKREAGKRACVPMEKLLKQPVAEHHNLIAAGAVLRAREFPPDLRRDAKHHGRIRRIHVAAGSRRNPTMQSCSGCG